MRRHILLRCALIPDWRNTNPPVACNSIRPFPLALCSLKTQPGNISAYFDFSHQKFPIFKLIQKQRKRKPSWTNQNTSLLSFDLSQSNHVSKRHRQDIGYDSSRSISWSKYSWASFKSMGWSIPLHGLQHSPRSYGIHLLPCNHWKLSLHGALDHLDHCLINRNEIQALLEVRELLRKPQVLRRVHPWHRRTLRQGKSASCSAPAFRIHNRSQHERLPWPTWWYAHLREPHALADSASRLDS